MGVLWGTRGFCIRFQHDTDSGISVVHKTLEENGLVRRGDSVIVVAGLPLPTAREKQHGDGKSRIPAGSVGHSKMGRQFLCLLAIALVGCGRLPFIAERMNNFAAYYNTYYNAEKALEEGIRNLEEQTRSQPVNQDVFLSLFGAGEGSVVRQEPFEDAVEKSCKPSS